MSKKQWWNFWWNIGIIIFEIIGLILLFLLPLDLWGEKWTYTESFKFYTTDSNLLLMIICIITAIYLLLFNFKKVKKIPTWVKFGKLMITTCTTLTMMAVLAFVPFTGLVDFKTPTGMFMNSNIFFHLLCPICAIIGYLLFEERSELKIWYTLLSVIPTAIYAIFYLSVALTHIQPGGVINPHYDWYGLSRFGVSFAPLSVMLALGFSFLFAWCLWYGNKKIYIKGLEK